MGLTCPKQFHLLNKTFEYSARWQNLFEEVNLALDGFFIKFNTDKNVRNGAIGIDGCGSSSPIKTGVVLREKTVRVKDTCNARGSKSVWAQIEYAQ